MQRLDRSRIRQVAGLTEWHPAVWIGRFFTLGNDVGEQGRQPDAKDGVIPDLEERHASIQREYSPVAKYYICVLARTSVENNVRAAQPFAREHMLATIRTF